MMEKQQLGQLTQNTCQIAAAVAEFISEEVNKVKSSDIEVKSLNSLVSYVDKNAEIQLVKGLQQLLPVAGFLTEEETIVTEKKEYRWIIDPLDGTTNFLHRLPFFAISIALEYQDEIILGVVYEVNRKECFYAWKGGGAFLNDEKIQVSQSSISDALIATGFPYYDYEGTKAYLKVLEYFIKNTRGVRRFGAAALDLAYVACGRFDAFFEYSLSPWDVAAGALLVQEAGGRVSDFEGGENFVFGKEIVATSPYVFDKTLEVIQGEFGEK